MNMKHIYRLFLFTTSLISCLLAACSEDERPDYLLPSFQVNEATEVTRTSALLTGEVILHGNGTVSDVHFRYGTTESMEQVASCPEGTLQAMARLNDLQPGTTYYFCLEASNGYSAVHSDTQTFNAPVKAQNTTGRRKPSDAAHSHLIHSFIRKDDTTFLFK